MTYQYIQRLFLQKILQYSYLASPPLRCIHWEASTGTEQSAPLILNADIRCWAGPLPTPYVRVCNIHYYVNRPSNRSFDCSVPRGFLHKSCTPILSITSCCTSGSSYHQSSTGWQVPRFVTFYTAAYFIFLWRKYSSKHLKLVFCSKGKWLTFTCIEHLGKRTQNPIFIPTKCRFNK